MKIGIVIYSNDSETVWNAFRFGNAALKEGDDVSVFLLGKAVKYESLDSDKFGIIEQARSLVESGGKLFACGTCLKIHKIKESEFCPLSTMKDLHEMVKTSDRVLTF